MKSAFIYHPDLAGFHAYKGYPWLFERTEVTYQLCKKNGLFEGKEVAVRTAVPAGPCDLLRFHTQSYVDLLTKANAGVADEKWLESGLGTSECPVYKGVFDYHLLATGGTLLGARLIDNGEADVVFNPSGGFHHAGRDFASGFCYINDIVLAIRKWVGRKKRVLYIDIDAHHGDQVQEAFYETGKVLCISFHESGKTLFPFRGGFENEIGKGRGKGCTVNVPLPERTSDEVFLWAFGRIFPPLVQRFKPDVIVAVIGADALFSDPMSHLQLTNVAYVHAVEMILGSAPKVLALGCGGYDIDTLARAWTLAWSAMADSAPGEEDAVSFGGMFWGDGLSSLKDHPLFVSDHVRAETEQEVRRIVENLEKHVFPLWNIKR